MFHFVASIDPEDEVPQLKWNWFGWVSVGCWKVAAVVAIFSL